MDCLFCKIIRGELDSETMYEDDAAVVIKDIHPRAPVHLLVVPKVHVSSILQLDASHRGMVEQMIDAARKAAVKSGLAGYKLVFNVGKEGGQIIDHLHLHILGGWEDGVEKKVGV